MRKVIVFLQIAILSAFVGCRPTPASVRLASVDSLVLAEEYDSAYHVIQRMEQDFDNERDKAHYQLLLAQTSYLTYNSLSSDSTIDGAIAYYEKDGDMEKLTDAYYYKAACSQERKDFTQAIQYFKKAEEAAQTTDNIKQQYKIAESLVQINGQCANYQLQLDYARKALAIALKSGNKNWAAYSYYNISKAFQNLNNTDSLTFYTKELIPRLDDIYANDRHHFLSCIGLMYYKNGQYELAKKYYEEALSHKEIAHTLENLADVYIKEGNEEEAYKLWQKAFLLNDGTTKDYVVYNMLQYDLGHHRNLEDACSRLYRVYAIKDSMMNALKDRTVQDLQQQYDEDRTNLLYERSKMRWAIATLILVVAILLLTGYIMYRRSRTKMMVAKHQMLISEYTHEINQLTAQCEANESNIRQYKEEIANYTEEINQLQASGEHSEKEIGKLKNQIAESNRLNQEMEKTCAETKRKIEEYQYKISEIVDKASPILNRGKVLYDEINTGMTTSSWNQYDYQCYVEYYKALHLMEYEALEQNYDHLTYHNTFFLILVELGKDSKEIGRIMGLSQEGIRSIKFRVQKRAKKG